MQFYLEHILSILLLTPIFGGVLILASFKINKQFAKSIALIFALLTLLLSVPLYTEFNFTTSELQFVERYLWISKFNIYYYIGIDGFSLPLILLTNFIQVLVVVSPWKSISNKLPQYLAAFMFMQTFMIGTFAALDGILFYIFWESLLIPMFLVIGIWGGERRVYATIKFFIYTFLGSVFMLLAFIYMYYQANSFSILDFHKLPLSMNAQILIFLAFFLAFAVKVPMFPVHTWLPDAHVEAPTAGSVVLAAIMLKMGGYGFVRFSLPIVPDAVMQLGWLVILFSLIAIVYIGFIALVQTDMKKLIAYSSISHMGFATLGIFLLFDIAVQGKQGIALGIEGAMVQMISHGFISAAMFLCVGVLYDRMHTRKISSYGGVVNKMPWFGFFFVLFAMANSGLPGTSGFVGEFMVILASFKANILYAILAATTLILGAAYSLWMVKRVIFGGIKNPEVEKLTDLTNSEFAILSVLAVMIIVFGFYPNLILDIMHASVENLINLALTSKLK